MIGKNSPCWCGSGKKYKHCHEEWDNTINVLKLQGKIVPSHNLIKSEEDIKWIKKAAKINNAVLDLVGEKICAGMTTEDIDKLVYDYTTSHGGIPACLGYEGFPKSVCTSINNEICHGIPSEKVVLKDGDIINVDCTTIVHKHFADASRMFCIGHVSDEAKRLVEVTKECLEIGKEAVRPWGYIGDIGAAIQEHAHKNGYSVVVFLSESDADRTLYCAGRFPHSPACKLYRACRKYDPGSAADPWHRTFPEAGGCRSRYCDSKFTDSGFCSDGSAYPAFQTGAQCFTASESAVCFSKRIL